MQTVTATGIELSNRSVADHHPNESTISAVSWAAVVAGAAVTLSVSMLLLVLASGFGLAAVSPWTGANAPTTTFTVVAAIGLVVTQWIASGLGGYITGRMRTKWTGVHTHEVFFRDTANGLLSWALATLVGMLLLASAASSIVGGGVHAAASVASGAGQAVAPGIGAAVSRYDVDSLFRSDRLAANGTDTNEVAGEVTRILSAGLSTGDMPAADRTYLAQLVGARTGISQADAEKRVDDVIGRAKAAKAKALEAADDARKMASKISIYTALSMLIGAFIACAAAAYGGNLRDEN